MNLNALKGVLIILVIFDHNDFSRSLFDAFLLGFGFHVLGFMTIPFLKPAARLDREFAIYAFRQYYPFFLLATVLSIALAAATPAAAWDQFRAWALAVYSGNSAALKQATHMSLLWFLPSFISLVALRSLIEGMGKAGKSAAITVLCAVHLIIGAIAAAVQDYLPLGLLPALYVIPLALLNVWLHRTVFEKLKPLAATALALAVFVPVKYLQMRAHLYNEVGFAVVADYRHPLALLLNDLEGVTGVLLLFQLARLPVRGLLEACGRYSIQIYLFHAFVAFAVYKAVLHLPAGVAVQLPVSLAITVLITLTLARRVAQHPFAQRFIFPRSPAALLGAGKRPDGPGRAAAPALAPSRPDLP